MSIFSDITNKLMNKSQKPAGAPLEPVSSINDQPEDEKKLVAYVREKLDSIRQSNSRIVMEGVYLTNVAYLMGFDGVNWDSKNRQFKNNDPSRKLSRGRFKVNKILPSVQNRLARLTTSEPKFDVRPESMSTEDKDASRLGLEVLKNIFDKQRFNEKRQNMLMSTMQGGSAYIQVVWDSTLGKPMADPDTEGFAGYEGDIRLEVLNTLEVFPDPLAKTLEDCQFLIKAKVRKLEYFKERYPDRGQAVKEESAWLLSSVYDLKTNALTSTGISSAGTNDQMKNSAIEIIYYEKRSEEYPKGRKIAIGSGILLEDCELPIGEFDIVKFDDIMVGDRYNAEAVITHLRPIQDQYNITRQKCADWVKKMLAGKYLAAKGHGLQEEALNNESGEVVEFNPVPNAPPPSAMTIPMIPQYVYKDLDTLDKELDYVSGINEISRGVLPSSSIPASGMAFLQEQDQTRIGVQTNRNELGYAKIASLILKYVSTCYEMPRVLKIAGSGMEYAVENFVGADLKDNHDVICIAGSTVPTSKVLKRQDIMNSFNSGLLGNPADGKLRAKVLGMMEFGDTAEMWKEQSLDEAQVKLVIKAIEEGNLQDLEGMLDEFDNHAMHLKEMNIYRKEEKFRKLDPAKKKIFKQVMEWRLQALLNIQQPQIAQQQMMAQTMVDGMHKQLADTGGGALGKLAQMTGQTMPHMDETGQVMGPGQMPPPPGGAPPPQLPSQAATPVPGALPHTPNLVAKAGGV